VVIKEKLIMMSCVGVWNDGDIVQEKSESGYHIL